MIEFALRLVTRHYYVFPCRPRDKRPITLHGVKDATCDADQARRWWNQWPEANIGVACGPSGLIVLDVDCKDGRDGLASLTELRQRMDFATETVSQLTPSGGMHLVYSAIGAAVHNSAGKLGPGLDIRADGGYIVVAPSKLANGAYCWVDGCSPDDIAPLPFPSVLADLLSAPNSADISTDMPTSTKAGNAYALKALAGEIETVRAATPGNRNVTLNTAAVKLGNLIATGALERAEVEAALTDAALATGLLQDEIKATLRSGIEAGLKQPRKIPEKTRRAQPTKAKQAQAGQPADEPRKVYQPTAYGNAERLVDKHGADLHFCHARRGWLFWDGKRWALDDIGEVVRAAKSTVRAMYAEAWQIDDVEERKGVAKHARSSESGYMIDAMIKLAKSEPGIPIRPSQLDADPWLLNVSNGTLDLRTGTLRSHRKEDLITKIAPVRYRPGIKLQLFDDFLETVTNDNRELAFFYQRLAGYTLTGCTNEEKLFFVHGRTATGKSTFLEALKAVLGEYAKTADFESFLQRSFTGGPRTDIADLAGARLVVGIEVDEGAKLAEGLIKTLVGGDIVKARHLYEDGFEFRPQFKLWLAANHAPRIKAEDDAMWRRILRLPFEHVIEREKRNPMVKEILRDPDVGGPAILAWALEGCLAWQREGLGVPPIVEQATESYRLEQDSLRDFWLDCCVFDPQAWTLAKELRKEYERWAEEIGETKQTILSARAFAERLKAKDCRSERKNSGRGWRGIRLSSTFDGQSIEPSGELEIDHLEDESLQENAFFA